MKSKISFARRRQLDERGRMEIEIIFRGYDTNAPWRHDEILRIRHMEAEIADMQKDIDRQKQKAVAAVERLVRTKKWLGIID